MREKIRFREFPPHPSPPFRMEERVPVGRERRRWPVQGFNARNPVGKILTPGPLLQLRGSVQHSSNSKVPLCDAGIAWRLTSSTKRLKDFSDYGRVHSEIPEDCS